MLYDLNCPLYKTIMSSVRLSSEIPHEILQLKPPVPAIVSPSVPITMLLYMILLFLFLQQVASVFFLLLNSYFSTVLTETQPLWSLLLNFNHVI